jgi:hypothetical protein
MVSIMHLEKAYDQVRYLYAELAGINKRPSKLSQDAAQLFAFHDKRTWDDIKELTVNEPGTYSVRDALGERLEKLAAGDKVEPRVQTNSMHNISGRGLVLACTILDGTTPASFINESIRYESKIYRIMGVEQSSANKRQVGFLVKEEARIPYHEPINNMVQNPGGAVGIPKWASGPTPPHVHAMSHEQRQRYENRGMFAKDALSEGFKLQKLYGSPQLGHDYADLEVRVFALAIKQMGLGEWFHELMEMVCFPDVEDALHLRNTIKEHLNDDRVKFLQEGTCPRCGGTLSSEGKCEADASSCFGREEDEAPHSGD